MKYTRRKGKPRFGRILIRRKRLLSLPDNTKISEVARILNTSECTIHGWIVKGLKVTDQDKLLRVNREDLIKFLRQTKRMRAT